MATAAEISRVRLFIEDKLSTKLDQASGNGSGTVFWLSHFPVYPDTETVAIGGTVQGTAAYSLTDASGRLAFTSAPATGTNNVVCEYQASLLTDAEIDDLFDEEGQSSILRAAALGWRLKAGKYAPEFDFSSDGSSYHRSQMYQHCIEMADKFDADAKKQVAAGGIYAGGVSIDDKDEVEDDNDRVQPAFKRGMMSYPGGATPWQQLDDPDV